MKFKDFDLIPTQDRLAFQRVTRDELKAVGETLEQSGVMQRLPDYTSLYVELGRPVAGGTSVREAQGGSFDEGTPAGLPRQPSSAVCPPGIVKVMIRCALVTRASDWYGYGGGHVSLLVSVPERRIWDARGVFDPTPPSTP